MPATEHMRADGAKPEARILFQTFFKSAGPRTYAAQVKEARNGNHFLVLTEGKRDEKTKELRKTMLLVFSEDFPALFDMLRETEQFVRANPVPDEVRQRQRRYWERKNDEERKPVPAKNAGGRGAAAGQRSSFRPRSAEPAGRSSAWPGRRGV